MSEAFGRYAYVYKTFVASISGIFYDAMTQIRTLQYAFVLHDSKSLTEENSMCMLTLFLLIWAELNFMILEKMYLSNLFNPFNVGHFVLS